MTSDDSTSGFNFDSLYRLVEAGEAWTAAQAERDAAILDAFKSGIPGPNIAAQIGLSTAAVYRIRDADRGHVPPSRRPGITIRIKYPTIHNATPADNAATKAVLAACEPYWVRSTPRPVHYPGGALASIEPEGWPTVAAAIRTARRVADKGWTVKISSSTVTREEIDTYPTV